MLRLAPAKDAVAALAGSLGVADDPDAARARAASAATRIRERFSLERAAAWLLDQAADASYEVARTTGEGAA